MSIRGNHAIIGSMKRELFKDKVLLITGGTGSFGNKVLDRFLKDDIELKEIRIFSRDEKKQEDMRIKYKKECCVRRFAS